MLPKCNQNIPPKMCLHTLGFGLDPFSKDYKVIYIRSYGPLQNDIWGRHCAVYRMSTDSWMLLKEKDVQFFEYLNICTNSSSVCVNGVYYWQMFRYLGLGLIDHKVLAFYLGTEVFQMIQSPVSESCGQLLPLHDRISICDTELLMHRKRSNEVWVLNSEGHWTKLLKIEPFLEVQKMFGFWKNGKVLVESLSGRLLLYDHETE
ncbi:hypothetical protein CRYUN_Cryun41cG0031700 [Craigia yunnanensis]